MILNKSMHTNIDSRKARREPSRFPSNLRPITIPLSFVLFLKSFRTTWKPWNASQYHSSSSYTNTKNRALKYDHALLWPSDRRILVKMLCHWWPESSTHRLNIVPGERQSEKDFFKAFYFVVYAGNMSWHYMCVRQGTTCTSPFSPSTWTQVLRLGGECSSHWATISPAHAPVCSVLVTDCERTDPSCSEREVKSMAGT